MKFLETTEQAPAENVIVVASNTPEWESLRMQSIGASEIATVFGLNEWQTRHHLWEMKVGITQPTQQNFRMMVGHYMEEGIAQMAASQLGFLSMQPDIGIRYHPEHSHLTATLDRWGRTSKIQQHRAAYADTFDDVYVMDCKCMGVWQHKTYKQIASWSQDDLGTLDLTPKSYFPPVHYWLQIQQQLLVSMHSIRPSIGYLACFMGGQRLMIWEIRPCVETHAQIIQASKQFIDDVNSLTEPDTDNYAYVDQEWYVQRPYLIASSTHRLIVVE